MMNKMNKTKMMDTQGKMIMSSKEKTISNKSMKNKTKKMLIIMKASILKRLKMNMTRISRCTMNN